MKVKSAIFALVLLLLGFGSEAKLCESLQKSPFEWCQHDAQCVIMCLDLDEGYTGGYCKGIMRRDCVCTKECVGGGNNGGGVKSPMIDDGLKLGKNDPAAFTKMPRRACGHT
ncbi:hypothetical protein EJB05_11727 [Eragrostis curvula]|uniref:Knottins-like domain-containing protein n=1 Tax=Eragrostis curvula TaxID=38414 RepID=A0A5J9VSJ8_9POAL|nr:hypothetical protein EJB05_11712 [Eragrostis curvula]TVU38364.1 hypothetical protein EJB05_11727 [Eragrostis curvula]